MAYCDELESILKTESATAEHFAKAVSTLRNQTTTHLTYAISNTPSSSSSSIDGLQEGWSHA